MVDRQFEMKDAKMVSIDEIVDVLSHAPTATTRERGWSGVTVDVYGRRPDCAGSFAALDHHTVCYVASGSARMVQRRAGVHEGLFSVGMSLLIPAGYDSEWDGDAPASVRMRVPSSLVAAAGEQIGRRSTTAIEIRNVFEARDAVIEHMALVLFAELKRPPHPAQALIVDQVSCALAAHLLRSYDALQSVEPCEPPPLGAAELARLTAFIEDNLGRSIGLAQLAAIVNVSRFHFTRLFKRSTGMTAIGFVEQCRIRRAQSLIADTDIPLAEIAVITGFADQSHFTRRFHRHLGCTPAAFAREHGRRRPSRRLSN